MPRRIRPSRVLWERIRLGEEMTDADLLEILRPDSDDEARAQHVEDEYVAAGRRSVMRTLSKTNVSLLSRRACL